MSEPVYQCQSKWEGVHCNGDGVERVVDHHPFSLAGMQMKLQANRFYICDDCWPRARPYILHKLGHPQETIDKALAEAGMDRLE